MPGIVILAAAYVISHFYRSFLAVLSPQLAVIGMSPAALSDALGAWFAAFALSQFLVGVMLDRYGPRWTTASLFAICGGGGGLLFAFAQSSSTVFVAMILLGVGCSPILMASVYIFKRSYNARKFATLVSTFIAVGLAGNILGSSPLAWAMQAYGWRSVAVGLSGLTILLSIMVLVTVRDPERAAPAVGPQGGYLDILKQRELWLILPLIFVNYGIVGGLRGIWAGPYFDLVHNMTATGIGGVTLAMAIAMACGSFAYGPIDRILNTRKWVVLGGCGISITALLYWVLHPAITPNGATVVLVVIGFFSLCYGPLMAHATANIPAHLAGRGITLVNFFNMGGVGIMQWSTSEVYRQAADSEVVVAGFESVLWFYAAAYLFVLTPYAFSRDVKPGR